MDKVVKSQLETESHHLTALWPRASDSVTFCLNLPTYEKRTIMVLTWPGIKTMINKWLFLLELLSFAAEPARLGEASLTDVVSISTSHAPSATPPPSLDSPSLNSPPSQNPKQIMRKIQNNLLNRYRGLLQGALTTLDTININKLT